MQVYRVRGWFKQGFQRQKFTRELFALSNEQALERIYSDLGSKHKLKRNQIHIEEITEIKPEEVSDPRILARLE